LALRKLLSLFDKGSSDKKFKSWIKSTCGYTPLNLSLYKQALLHRSHSTVSKSPVNNERLEFLGDAILGAIVADYLFEIYPYKNEGFLTQLRSRIVNGESLKILAKKFGFELHLKTNSRRNERPSTYALGDAFEAFIGALYLDHGFNKTKKFVVSRIIKTHLDLDKLVQTNVDFKSQLQIFCQKNKLPLEYKLISEEMNGKDRLYIIQVFVNNKPYARFENYSKRLAEQKAAELSLEELTKEYGEIARTEY
jgi:ribonuclease-3